MNRRTGTLALLAALCVLAAAVEARSPTLRDDADKYCTACRDGREPTKRPIRGADEVKLCDDRYYCDCQAGTKERCAILHKFNPDSGECEWAAGPMGFSCQEWMDKHPVPTPAPPAPSPATSPAPTSTSRPAPTPTTGPTTKGPAPGSSTTKPAPGSSTTKPAPGSSTSKPAPVPGSSTSKPAPVPGSSTSKPGPAPGSSTSKPAPVPGSSTSKPAPVPGSSTIKPKPNGAPWGHRAGLGLLALGVAAALL